MAVVTRPDHELKKEAMYQLDWDSRVDTSHIKVDASEGRIILTGTVPTYRAKLAAETDVLSVPGATAIDNALRIEPRPSAEAPADNQIRRNIIDLLEWNTSIDMTEIEVSVNKGEVTFDGSVPTYWQKVLVEEAALDLAGVGKVVNRLSVVPTENVVDEAVAKAIVAAFDNNFLIDVDSVNVQVSGGVVTLTGTVSSWTAYFSALTIVRRTLGVTDIRDMLRVE